MHIQHAYNSSTIGCIFTHVLTLSATEEKHKLWFDKNRTYDFRTSRCAGHLLDHSGDDIQYVFNGAPRTFKKYIYSKRKSIIGTVME